MLVMPTVAHDDNLLQLGIVDLGNCLPLLVEKGRSIVMEEVVQLLPIPLPLLFEHLVCSCGGFVFAGLVDKSMAALWTGRKQLVINFEAARLKILSLLHLPGDLVRLGVFINLVDTVHLSLDCCFHPLHQRQERSELITPGDNEILLGE